MIASIIIGSSAWAIPIPESEIQVFGTQGYNGAFLPYNEGDPANTIDDDLDIYWVGTNGLLPGDTNFLAYKFNTQ